MAERSADAVDRQRRGSEQGLDEVAPLHGRRSALRRR
jgi:hypothetical protein